MSLRRFLVLIRGLSGESLFRSVMAEKPHEVEGQDATQQVIDRM